MKTALDLRVLKLQTTNNPNCWFSAQTAHSSIRIWTDNCQISISRKLQFTKNLLRKHILFVFNNIAILGGLEDSTISFPPVLLLEANWVHSYWRQPSQKNDRSQWKSALYCSLSNSKTRAVYSLHGIDYSCKAKPCETKRWVNILHVAESFVQWEGFTCRMHCFLVSADMGQ